MRDHLLLVMNPRRIGPCLAAINTLDIDKLWIRNLTESRIAQAWPSILDIAAGYDRMIMAGDDSCPRQHALDAVLTASDAHRVVTGWSNLSASDWRANLVRSPLREPIGPEAYDLFTAQDVMEHPDPVFRTWLTGLTLCCMTVDDWHRFPFDCFDRDGNGYGSDYHLSKRLDAAGVPIMAVRDAFVWHHKAAWNEVQQDTDERLLVGVEPEALVLETKGETVCTFGAF